MSEVCKELGCTDAVVALDLCSKHYQRFWKKQSGGGVHIEPDFFSVDPGGTCMGWAQWRGGKLFACGLSRNEHDDWQDRAATHRAFLSGMGAYEGLVLCESMRVRGGNGKGNPQILVELNAIAGHIGNAWVEPQTWKKSLPRDVEESRTRVALATEELRLLESVTPPSLAHNAWSAVGIGLYYLGRAHAARNFDVEAWGVTVATRSTVTSNGCLLWTGAVDENGYAMMTRGGRYLRVSRLVLEASLGRVLKAKEHACHLCDNPTCVAEAHLVVGSARDNCHDKVAKGRAKVACGEAAPTAKLNEADVEEVKSLYATGLYSHRSLGVRFGVSHTAIGWALRGQSWARGSGVQPVASDGYTKLEKKL